MAASSVVITMTMREADRLKTIPAVVDRMLRVGRAAQRLGVNPRQIERMLLRYEAEGPVGVTSRQRGRPSHSALDALNQRFGRGTVSVASAMEPAARPAYQAKRERMSPRYTSRIDEIPTAR